MTHYTLHTTHYTLHTTHYTLHTTHYTPHTEHRSSIPSPGDWVGTKHQSSNTKQDATLRVMDLPEMMQSRCFSIGDLAISSLQILPGISGAGMRIKDLEPRTQNPKPETRHPKPDTRNPPKTPSLKPEIETRTPKTENRKPKLKTLASCHLLQPQALTLKPGQWKSDGYMVAGFPLLLKLTEVPLLL